MFTFDKKLTTKTTQLSFESCTALRLMDLSMFIMTELKW